MRRTRHKLQVSTFPFLAVLLAAMGSLILLLLVMDRRAKIVARNKSKEALTAKGNRTKESAEKRRQELAKQQDDWEQQQAALHAHLAAQVQELVARKAKEGTQADQVAGQLRFELAQLQALEDQLGKEQANLTEEQKKLQERHALVATKDGKSQDFLAERQKLANQLAQLEAALRDLQMLKGQEQNTFSLVAYRGKRGENRRPIYVECRRDGVVFHPTGKTFSALTYSDEAFRDEVKAQGAELEKIPTPQPGTRKRPPAPLTGPYVLFLVRPNAIDIYYEAAGALKGYQIDFGYELIESDWLFDFGGGKVVGPKNLEAVVKSQEPGSVGFGPPGLGSGGTSQGTKSGAGPGGHGVVESTSESGFGHPGSGMAGSGPGSGFSGQGIGNPGTGMAKPNSGAGFFGGGGAGTDSGGGVQGFRSGMSGTGFGTSMPKFGGAGDSPGFPNTGFATPRNIFGGSGGYGNNPGAQGNVFSGSGGKGKNPGAQGNGFGGSGGIETNPGAKGNAVGSSGGKGNNPGSQGNRYGEPGGNGTNPSAQGGGNHAGAGNQPPRIGPENPDWRPAQQPGKPGGISQGGSGDAPPREPPDPPDPRKQKPVLNLGTGTGGTGGESDPLNRLPTLEPQPKTKPKAKSAPPTSRLTGNRDFVITIECYGDSAAVYPGGKVFAPKDADALAKYVQQLITRRQASVRAGEPPYRPQLRFEVLSDGLRTYYRMFPPLEGLRLPMSRENVAE